MNAKNMDSVFSGATESDAEFDVMFDQEDSLIDTVNGVNEAGEPLTGVDFDQLHQTDDDATVKDVKDNTADDNDMGADNPEGTKSSELDDASVEGEVGKESEADKFHGDAESEYQDGKDKGSEPDPEDIEKTIDKVVEGTDLDDVLLGDEDDDNFEEGCASKEPVKEEKSEEPEVKEEPGVDNEPVEEKSLLIDSIEEEIEKEKDKPVEESKLLDDDVEAVDSSDLDDENEVIDAAIGSGKKSKKNISSKYDYETSDEDLIDMAINGDIE